MSASTMVTFTAGGRVVGVDVPDASLAPAVRALLPAHTVEHATADEWCFLRADEDVWRIGEPGGEESVVATLDEALDGLEVLITWRLLNTLPAFLHLHAAGARAASGAVLALGPSGAGKSTLARAWAQAGQPVFGDDIVLLDTTGRAHAFRRRFRVHAGTDDKAFYDPAAEGAAWGEPAPVQTIALVRYRPGPLEVVPLSPAAVVEALTGAMMPSGLSLTAGFDALVHVARAARGLRVVFGDATDAVGVLA